MLTPVTDAYDAFNTSWKNNPAAFEIVFALVLLAAKPLWGLVRSVVRADRQQRLSSELTDLRKFRDEDKLPHIAALFDSFLSVTLAVVLFEVFLYYVSEFLFKPPGSLDPFVYFAALMIYAYVLMLMLQRLKRIVTPSSKRIAELEKRLGTFK